MKRRQTIFISKMSNLGKLIFISPIRVITFQQVGLNKPKGFCYLSSTHAISTPVKSFFEKRFMYNFFTRPVAWLFRRWPWWHQKVQLIKLNSRYGINAPLDSRTGRCELVRCGYDKYCVVNNSARLPTAPNRLVLAPTGSGARILAQDFDELTRILSIWWNDPTYDVGKWYWRRRANWFWGIRTNGSKI